MSNIEQAVSEILATRDMCGDEQQCLRDIESELGKFSATELQEIWAKVNGTWKESQVAAGAKILNSHERDAAHAALEDDWGDPDENWTPEYSRRLRANHARNNANFTT